MPKLKPIAANGQIIGYRFHCPGCRLGHFVTIRPFETKNGASWDFNGDVERPTFHPSILDRIDFTEVSKAPFVCHSYVRDGKIQFLNDCTHALAGQTVELPEQD